MNTQIARYRTSVVALTAALVLVLAALLGTSQHAGALEGPVEVVYVATGQNYPDALAGATLAATAGSALLMVNPDPPLPQATVAALQQLDPDRIVIFGGPGAVSNAVAGELTAYARSGSVTRIFGDDRFATAAAIADALPDKVHNADRLDGYDSSEFWRKAEDVDAATLGGFAAGDLSGIFGIRNRDTTREDAPEDFGVIRTVEFTAPTDGVVFVASQVFLANGDASPSGAAMFLLLDWDGEETSLIDSVIGIDTRDYAASGDFGDTGTMHLTTAVPVSAGSHTIGLALSAEDFEYNVPTLTVLFSPFGSADPAGLAAP